MSGILNTTGAVSGILGTTVGTPAGGAWSYVSTITASDSASVDFTDLGADKAYMVVYQDVVSASNNVEFWIRTSTDNGSSYDSGGSDYYWCVGESNENAVTQAGSVSSSKLRISSQNLANADNFGASGYAYLIDPSKTDFTTVVGDHYLQYNAGNSPNRQWFGGRRQSAADVTAFQFLMSSGNVATGLFVLYKLAAS